MYAKLSSSVGDGHLLRGLFRVCTNVKKTFGFIETSCVVFTNERHIAITIS